MSEKWFGQPTDPSQEQLEQTTKLGSSEPLSYKIGDLYGDELTEYARSHTKQEIGEVDEQDWQERINAAFQQGDFELIKLLQRVRPEMLPDQETVHERICEVIISRPNKWAESLREIRAVSHAELDQTLIADEFSKLFDQFGQEKGILDQLKEFMQATGYKPAAEIVHAKYKDVFTSGRYYRYDIDDLIKDIRNLTGIQPEKQIFDEVVASGDIIRAKEIAQYFGVEITSDMIQEAYQVQFEKSGYIDPETMRKAGEMPNPALIAKLYQAIVERYDRNWMDAIESLKRTTGVDPNLTSEQLGPIFEDYLSKGWFGQKGYVGIEHIIEQTGIKPTTELVQKFALKIIDGGHEYIDQGKRISEQITRLRESTGIEFEIPESEVQERYRKAIAERKPHVLTNLYGALGVKPSIENEEARQFMLSFMDHTYHNPIKELENLFGIEFKATEEEIKAKYEENLANLNFEKVAKIKEITGQDCDKQKMAQALGQLLRKAIESASDHGNYSEGLLKNLKHFSEQFEVAVPPEVVLSLYNDLITNEIINGSAIQKIYQATGIELPAELAQRAYERILQPSYTGYISTGENSVRSYGIASAFAEIYKASDTPPEVNRELVQQFYKRQLESGWNGINEIKKVAEITGISPEFIEGDVNALYKQWILNGQENYIKSVRELTGIELKLDEETSTHVSQTMENALWQVSQTNYESEQYGEKRFDSYRLEQDLRRIGSLSSATGISPNSENLQSIYAQVLENDPYWSTKIEQIIKATNIKPELDSQLIQSKGEQLLARGALRSLQRLQEFGNFIFSPELTQKAYDALIEANRRNNEYDSRQYYENGWLDSIKRLQEMSQIPPTEHQIAEILGHMIKDKQYSGRGYDKISSVLDILEKDFGIVPNDTTIKAFCQELFTNGDWENLTNLKKRIGHAPEIPAEIVQTKCDELLKEHDFNTLETIQATLELKTIPLTSEIVQADYLRLIENPKFATYGDKDIGVLYRLFELTHIQPKLSEEQISLAYRRVMFQSYDGSYEKFERVVGVPPTKEDLQNRIYNWLVEDYLRRDVVTKFIEKYHVSVSPEIAKRAAMRRLEKTSLKKFKDTVASIGGIEEISGSQVQLEADIAENLTKKILETHQSSEYSCTELGDLFSWFERVTGQKPSQDLVDLAYSRTLNQTVSYEKAPDGGYLKAWDWLKQGYGLPSPRAVQLIYLAELMK